MPVHYHWDYAGIISSIMPSYNLLDLVLAGVGIEIKADSSQLKLGLSLAKTRLYLYSSTFTVEPFVLITTKMCWCCRPWPQHLEALVIDKMLKRFLLNDKILCKSLHQYICKQIQTLSRRQTFSNQSNQSAGNLNNCHATVSRGNIGPLWPSNWGQSGGGQRIKWKDK